MMLAELSAYDPPIMIGCVLGCLMFLVVGGNAAAEFWRNLKDKPGTPPNEQLEAAHQHLRDEFDKHCIRNQQEHDNFFKKLGGAERGIEIRLTEKIEKFGEAAETSRASMHEHISELSNGVAALEAKAEMTNQRIVQIDGKLDRLIEKS